MLSCYRSEFYMSISDVFPDDSNSVLRVKRTDSEGKSVYYPYSADSKVSWSADGTLYAVYTHSYVYICDKEAGTELCRIFLEPDGNSATYTKQVKWLEEKIIAIITNRKKVLIYDFHTGLPVMIAEFDMMDNGQVDYSPKNRYLYLQEGKNIVAKSIVTGDIIFSIKIKHRFGVAFGVDDGNDEIYIRDTLSVVKIYNATDGTFIKEERIKAKKDYIEFCTFFSCEKAIIHKIKDGQWLIISNHYGDQFTVYDTAAKTRTFLHPPQQSKVTDFLVGKRYFLAVYENAMILIDLHNSFEMKWLKISHIKSVSWKSTDMEISVLNESGLNIVAVEDFKSLSKKNSVCMQFKKRIFGTVYLAMRELVKYSGGLRLVFWGLSNTNNMFRYDSLFFLLSPTVRDDLLKKNDGKRMTSASVIVFANDGKKAVAYEEEGVVIVFNKDNQPLLNIDKLKLALCDDILKLCFSRDSEKLFIWRTHSIQVIDINTGTMKLNMDITGCPALDADFDGEDLVVTLRWYDGRVCRYDFSDPRHIDETDFPERMDLETESEKYAGPCTYRENKDGEIRVFNSFIASEFDLEVMPNHWFSKEKVYHGEKYWLYFNNGEFFLNGDEEKRFSHEFFGFDKCLQAEVRNESRAIRMYLHHKNDLFSRIIETGGKYIILISRILNSVIVFDVEQLKVLSAYKSNGNIIGFDVNEDGLILKLIVDRAPYQEIISVVLPN